MVKFLYNITLIGICTTLLLMGGNAYAMSMSHTAQIYDKIARANGFNVAPRLIEDMSSEINAYSGGFRITVNKGMLDFVGSDNQMALVLGHELAHYSLGHNGSTIANEYAADALGARYMQTAGYNKCSGAILFKRMPYQGASSDHPPMPARVRALGCH